MCQAVGGRAVHAVSELTVQDADGAREHAEGVGADQSDY